MMMKGRRIAKYSSAKVTYLENPGTLAEAAKVGLRLVYAPSITRFVWAGILPLRLDVLVNY